MVPPIIIARFYVAMGAYFANHDLDPLQVMQFFDKSLKLSKLCGDTTQQCDTLIIIAQLMFRTGDFCSAQVHCIETQRLAKSSANLSGGKGTGHCSPIFNVPR